MIFFASNQVLSQKKAIFATFSTYTTIMIFQPIAHTIFHKIGSALFASEASSSFEGHYLGYNDLAICIVIVTALTLLNILLVQLLINIFVYFKYSQLRYMKLEFGILVSLVIVVLTLDLTSVIIPILVYFFWKTI